MSGRITVVLGGIPRDLPVLPRKASREWLASLDARFSMLAGALDSADTPQILALLANETDALYELLLEYDRTGVLPPRGEIDDYATDAEILRATLEVWSALHPLAVTLVAASTGTDGTTPEPSSPSPMPTAGDPTTSMPSSPTSSSSPTSMLTRTALRRGHRRTSTAGSRP